MSEYAPITASDKLFQKTNRDLTFWLRDADGNDLNTSGMAFRWILATENEPGAPILIDKSSPTIQSVNYIEGDEDPSPGTTHANAGVNVPINAVDIDIDAGSYWHELWDTVANEILAFGPVLIRPSVVGSL